MLIFVRLILSSLSVGIPPHILREAYDMALDWCIEYLESSSCPFVLKLSWKDLDNVIAVIKCIIGTKQACRLSEIEIEYLSTLMVEVMPLNLEISQNFQAFVKSVSLKGTFPRIRILPSIGESMSSESFSGNFERNFTDILGMIIPFALPIDFPKLVRKVSVLLFEVSLIMDDNHKKWEISRINKLGEAIVASGAKILASQKLIHPYLQTYLLERVNFGGFS
jgi:hypothetical protein